MTPTTAEEALEFIRGKIKRHTALIKHHNERLEKYRAIENGLCQVRFLTGHIYAKPEEEQEHNTQSGARCRFTPDPDDDEDNIIPKWEAEPEDFTNAERVRRLGEKFAAVKQEEDQDSDDDLNRKLPAKGNSHPKRVSKKALIAEGHAKARAWAADRPPNPRMQSSPANLRQSRKERRKEVRDKMGNMLSTSSDEEVAENITYPSRRDEVKYADIKLSCDSFMKFDGTLDKWFPFKEDVLAQTGPGGYAYFFEPNFVLTAANKLGNQRIYFMLKLATNGGTASAFVNGHKATQDGHGAWTTLMEWYEGPLMSVKQAKVQRDRIRQLKLRLKDSPHKHIHDFIFHRDQLIELGRPIAEEELVDLFIDSLIDPSYNVARSLCRRLKYTTLEQCFETVREHAVDTLREEQNANTAEVNQLRQKIRRLQQQRQKGGGPPGGNKEANKSPVNKEKENTGYIPYEEWQKLSSEERKAIHQAPGSRGCRKDSRGEEEKTTPEHRYPVAWKRPGHLGAGERIQLTVWGQGQY